MQLSYYFIIVQNFTVELVLYTKVEGENRRDTWKVYGENFTGTGSCWNKQFISSLIQNSLNYTTVIGING